MLPELLTLITGSGFTETVNVAVPVHPEALSPVTEYEVCEDGLTVTALLPELLNHV
jgi:hypothetical protein